MRNPILSRGFAPPDRWEADGWIALDPEESRHLTRALRAKPGDCVEAFDGLGRRAICRVLETGKTVRLRAEETSIEPEPIHRFRLAVGMPRENKLEWLLQKGTELGMFSITVFSADRSVVRLAPDTIARRMIRWERIARDAARQSGRCRLPRLNFALDLKSVLRHPRESKECRIACSLEAPPGSLRAALAAAKSEGTVIWTVFIGPEGDFSREEMESLRQAQTRAVSLGSRVLRVETASLYILSCLLYETETG